MSTNHPYGFTSHPEEFQARVAAAMVKARRERAHAVATMLGDLWAALRRGFKAAPTPAIVHHERRSLAGCS